MERTFKEWIMIQTGKSWNQLQAEQVTPIKVSSYYREYEAYCMERDIKPSFEN